MIAWNLDDHREPAADLRRARRLPAPWAVAMALLVALLLLAGASLRSEAADRCENLWRLRDLGGQVNGGSREDYMATCRATEDLRRGY